MEIIIAIIGVILGAAGVVYAIRTKKQCIKLDYATIDQNQKIEQENQALSDKNFDLKNELEEKQYLRDVILQELEEISRQRNFQTEQLNQLIQKKTIVNSEIEIKNTQLTTLTQNLETLTSGAQATARASFEQYCNSLEAEYVLREKEFDHEVAILDELYETRFYELMAREDRLLKEQHQDLDTLVQLFYDKQQKMSQEYEKQEAAMRMNLANIREELEKIRATRAAAIEAQLREEEIKNKATFYTLQVNDADKRDITYLQSIEFNLREARPLRMLIWSTFYRDKVNDLAARVGAVGACGIYKITHIDSGLSYIGQARDIKERWVTHVKCSLGIDTPVTSQLYAFTREKGIDNFTFEILEKCSAAELNEKEKFYIDLYQTYDFGLNATKGNK